MPTSDSIAAPRETLASGGLRLDDLLTELARIEPAEADQAPREETQRAALERARAIAGIVAKLTDDDDILRGAALYPLLGVLAWRSSRRPILEK